MAILDMLTCYATNAIADLMQLATSFLQLAIREI
jgi:hypothetical protein